MVYLGEDSSTWVKIGEDRVVSGSAKLTPKAFGVEMVIGDW
jgi:hypothetical protein